MLSLKRLLYIILIVAVLGIIFLVYTVNESRPVSAQLQSGAAPEREFTETAQVDEGERPRVWILGDINDERYGEIYGNVRQFCEGLHLTVAGEGDLDVGEARAQDLVIFCDAFISRYADPKELESFIAEGGRVILAAGLAEGNEDSSLWPVFGIQEKSVREDCHDMVFEKPLFPVQPEEAYYGGNSGSARIEAETNASVYIRDAQNDVPIFYTYAWQKGSICLINGTFLTDIRFMGLLTGAMAALLPDFIYPVLGVKAVFLDNFPEVTSADDELCRRVYGYSAEGVLQDVIWPVFQGISLRTDTPYTAGILTAASSEESFKTADDDLLSNIGKSVQQLGGELAYAAEMPDMQFSCGDGRVVFPAATKGNSMEDGNLFAICSVLGAYGMVSHVFDVSALIASDEGTAAWDSDKRQIELFESEVLAQAPWLEGRTLSQTGSDVKSYRDMGYGWIKNGSRLEFHCSDAVKGQALFYHTDSRIAEARGLDYEDVGNGYYLLRIQENHGIITLEEGK